MSKNSNNYQSLIELCEGDASLISAIIQTMTVTFPEHVSIVDAALESWDGEQLRETLHLIKGSLSYLSLQEEANLIISLESYVSTDDKDKFKQDYSAIRNFMLSLPKSLEEEHNQYYA